ncbi:MAG: OmpA family protein [Bernardetiaceae bacterium]|nr:OmpA family protein [Bernardetiaceae bacterium]
MIFLHKLALQLLPVVVLFFIGILGLSAQEFEDYKILKGHIGGVQTVRFSPDGKYLGSGGLDNQVVIWDVETGEIKHKLTGFRQNVHEVTFSPDGSLVAAASGDGTVRIWQVANGSLVGSYVSEPFVFADGSIFNSVSFVVFSADQKFVYFAGDSGQIMKARIDRKDQRAKSICSMNQPDGSYYATVTGGTLSRDGKALIVSVGNYVRAIDLRSERIIKTFTYNAADINDVVLGPGKNHITSWSYDGIIMIWDYEKEKDLRKIRVTSEKNYSAATFSPDGKQMATGAYGNQARIWDLATGQNIAKLNGHSKIVRVCRFSPIDNKIIATASYDGTVRLWREKEVKQQPIVINPPKEDKQQNNTNEALREEQSHIDTEDSIDETELTVGNTITMHAIQFKQGKPELFGEGSFKALEQLSRTMKKYPNMRIRLEGHTDNVGTQSLNMKLAAERIQAVKDVLIREGIAEKRIEMRAFGPTRPIAPNDSEENRKRNRRVEIVILSK